MKSKRPLRVLFFKSETGREPVREWLKSLPDEERKTIGVDILKVQYAWPIGKPLVDNLGNAIWEIRSRFPNRIARLFAIVEGEIILLHGFIKKQQKTPVPELNLAKKRLRQYLSENEEKE